jgi:hypothetical protein
MTGGPGVTLPVVGSVTPGMYVAFAYRIPSSLTPKEARPAMRGTDYLADVLATRSHRTLSMTMHVRRSR